MSLFAYPLDPTLTRYRYLHISSKLSAHLSSCKPPLSASPSFTQLRSPVGDFLNTWLTKTESGLDLATSASLCRGSAWVFPVNAARGILSANGIFAPASINRPCATDHRVVDSRSAPFTPGGENEKSGNGTSLVVATFVVGENSGGGFCPLDMPSRP